MLTKFNIEKGEFMYVGRNNLKYTLKRGRENRLLPVRRHGCKYLCAKCQLTAQGTEITKIW